MSQKPLVIRATYAFKLILIYDMYAGILMLKLPKDKLFSSALRAIMERVL